jgi:formyl-CoA transferase/CoA:oxalate CoA-transferase
VVQAFSGLMSVTGPPGGEPTRVGVAIVDVCTGLNAAIGILAALRARESTGRGQIVDVSLLGTAVSTLPNLTAGYLVDGAVPERLGNGHPNATPYGAFESADGYVVVAVGQDAQWQKLCSAFGEPEVAADPRYLRNADRVRLRGEVDDLIQGWCRQHTTAELVERFTGHGVPHGPVYTVPEALGHPQVEALGLVQSVALEGGESVSLVRSAIAFSQDGREEAGSPPGLGADTAAVLGEIGVDEAELRRLRFEGAFGAAETSDP